MNDGACGEATPEVCTALGGSPQGPDTYCDTVDRCQSYTRCPSYCTYIVEAGRCVLRDRSGCEHACPAGVFGPTMCENLCRLAQDGGEQCIAFSIPF
jgi:hypothetical protein